MSVVQAVQGFLGPQLVTTGWLEGRSVMQADDAATCYAQATWQWGRTHIPDNVDVERFNLLAQQLIDAADGDALPLFAGWRAQPYPTDDPVAAAMQRVHVLREHRGACHLLAVRACGLTGYEAMVANLGPDRATHYGWDAPLPPAAPLIPQWQRAEQLTNELQAPLYATLTAPQRVEFAQLVHTLTNS